MVVHQFPNRADAKNAVCLAALAAGVRAYVRAISAALDAKISPKTKTLVYESLIPFRSTRSFGQISYLRCLSRRKIMMVCMIYLCCIVMYR